MGLLGPNGAGKTTLIKILSTLVTPDEGTGSIAGLCLHSQAMAIKSKIGMVNTNDRTFYWRLSGRENLSFFATLYNISGKLQKERIHDVLQLTDMEEKAEFKFMSYSAGQKQRLAIARALLANPEILLMDEATTSLDPIACKKLLKFTKETLVKKKQRTVIWCTHNLHEAEEICDSVTILNGGNLLYNGTFQGIADCSSIEQSFIDLITAPHPSSSLSPQ